MPELIDDRDLRVWRAFLTAHARVIARIDSELGRRSLIPLDWYDLLVAIQLSPTRRLRLKDLAAQLLLTRSNATRLADRLQAQGLIERTPDPADRRGTYALLTPAGRGALRRAWPVYARAIEHHFLDLLDGDERIVIGGALERIAAAATPASARRRRPVNRPVSR